MPSPLLELLEEEALVVFTANGAAGAFLEPFGMGATKPGDDGFEELLA